MGKASDWLREERRKVLGDWVAVCLRCGAARRWFEEFEAEVPDECPQCGGELVRRIEQGADRGLLQPRQVRGVDQQPTEPGGGRVPAVRRLDQH